MAAFSSKCLSGISEKNFLMTLRMLLSTFRKQLRRSLQTKKIITNKCSLCVIVCCIAKNIINNSKKGQLLRHIQRSQKMQKLHRKRSKNWFMMSFIHSGSEIRILVCSQLLVSKTRILLTKVNFNRCKTPQISHVGTKFKTTFLRLHQHKDTLAVRQLTARTIFIATHLALHFT